MRRAGYPPVFFFLKIENAEEGRHTGLPLQINIHIVGATLAVALETIFTLSCAGFAGMRVYSENSC